MAYHGMELFVTEACIHGSETTNMGTMQ